MVLLPCQVESMPAEILAQMLIHDSAAPPLCGTGILPVRMTGWKPVPHQRISHDCEYRFSCCRAFVADF